VPRNDEQGHCRNPGPSASAAHASMAGSYTPEQANTTIIHQKAHTDDTHHSAVLNRKADESAKEARSAAPSMTPPDRYMDRFALSTLKLGSHTHTHQWRYKRSGERNTIVLTNRRRTRHASSTSANSPLRPALLLPKSNYRCARRSYQHLPGIFHETGWTERTA